MDSKINEKKTDGFRQQSSEKSGENAEDTYNYDK